MNYYNNQKMTKALRIVSLYFVVATSSVQAGTFAPKPENGYPAGLIPVCPGVLKNASISSRSMEYFQISLHRITSGGQISRKMMPIENAAKMIAKDKLTDLKNKKTVLYAVGYMDSSLFPFSQAIGTAYSKRGYNVLIPETMALLASFYPKSVRVVHVIGRKIGEFLVKLSHLGLAADDLELVGTSLGAHVVAHAAKYFYEATGKKPSRITGLDPAGPCFRALDSGHKLWATDAERVDVIHTNIDGFGIAERLGHLDIYVNGGEFQPGDIPELPCLVVCSHARAMIYWWQSLLHPKRFVGVKCETVQDARFGNCFNNTGINYMGLEANFDRPGIYYLPTSNKFPYFMGKDGFSEPGDNIFTRIISDANSEDMFMV